MSQKEEKNNQLVSNRKAFHLYHILEKVEAGIELQGCEVKSLRLGTANFQDCYASIKDGQVYLKNMHISPYAQGNRENPDPVRTRRLLLHKREIKKLADKVAQKGLTLVPLGAYLKGNKVKISLAVAKGKNVYDKRETLKEKDIKRDTARELRDSHR
ncbi:SsrA-binding protein SmpB [bacterium]|nr:SsrA-binding protein SmpB [bacterium]